MVDVTLKKRVKEIISEASDNAFQIDDDTRLDLLGVDSIVLLAIALRLEEEFSVSITGEAYEAGVIKTLTSLTDFIESEMNHQK